MSFCSPKVMFTGSFEWTTITPSADSRIVYVSSSEGNDTTNSGLSESAPKATIAAGKALIRDLMPDHLLLKRGDVFNESIGGWSKMGRSPEEPILISAYGIGPRPVVDATSGISLTSPSRSTDNMAIIGVEFYNSAADPQSSTFTGASGTCILWLGGNNILIEDCMLRYYNSGFSIQGYGSRRSSNVALRRNVIANSYSTTSHSQGAYFYSIDGLLLEENVFDHNGWNESVAGAQETVYNHNTYIKENVTQVTVRGNIFANASSHGLQARSGGTVTGNLFIDNPIGMSYGYVNGSPITPGGVSGTVSGNVFLGGRDIAGSPRGWCMEIGNIAPNSGTAIRDNICAHDTQAIYYAAIQLSFGSIDNPLESPGINDLVLEQNVVYNWYIGLWLPSTMVPGGTGYKSLNGLVVRDNDFQRLLAASAAGIEHGPGFLGSAESFNNNRYSGEIQLDPGFSIASVNKTITQWQTEVEPSAQAVQVVYTDPSRSVASYNATIDGIADQNVFLDRARQQSCSSGWLRRYNAKAVIEYIREGFGLTTGNPMFALISRDNSQ